MERNVAVATKWTKEEKINKSLYAQKGRVFFYMLYAQINTVLAKDGVGRRLVYKIPEQESRVLMVNSKIR